MIRDKILPEHKSAGLMAIIVFIIAIGAFFLLQWSDHIFKFVWEFFDVLKPFIYGLVMAYLVCPLYNLVFDKTRNYEIFDISKSSKSKKNKNLIFARILASTVSVIAILLIIAALIWMILPGLIESITSISKTLPDTMKDLVNSLQSLSNDLSQSNNGFMGNFLNDVVGGLKDWVQTKLAAFPEMLVNSITSMLLGLVTGITNFIIGIIISVFFLNSKDIFTGQIRKLIVSLFNEKKAKQLIYAGKFTNKTFGDYINANLIDSAVVGVVCFVFMAIVNWPYALLISVIIAVTNLIPFFGPFIGGIPAFLILYMKIGYSSFWFVLFILVLQQIEGNIVKPKILSGMIGLSSFWVMFAIIVGGGLFGFAGMILGIPIFACIYEYFKYKINSKLVSRGYTENLVPYMEITAHLEGDVEGFEKIKRN
ncbi:MAG: AI-2E family transporter [Eubacteriales bacterium]|nr:AI-2E family transporter [Eubacteriales bacterium]MDY3333072.1 AI-2E family transporter [Gallibacter sp.]